MIISIQKLQGAGVEAVANALGRLEEADLSIDQKQVLTAHKMQGSQAREVSVLCENYLGRTEDDRRRWLYTACTRATEQVNLVFE